MRLQGWRPEPWPRVCGQGLGDVGGQLVPSSFTRHRLDWADPKPLLPPRPSKYQCILKTNRFLEAAKSMEAIQWMQWGQKAATTRTAPRRCGRQSQGGDGGRWAGSGGRKQSRSVQIGAPRETSLLFCEVNDRHAWQARAPDTAGGQVKATSFWPLRASSPQPGPTPWKREERPGKVGLMGHSDNRTFQPS